MKVLGIASEANQRHLLCWAKVATRRVVKAEWSLFAVSGVDAVSERLGVADLAARALLLFSLLGGTVITTLTELSPRL